MKLKDYKKEIETDLQSRIQSISSLLKSIDIETLQQRKLVYDYLVSRTDCRFVSRADEFEDIIAVVSYFSEQVPEFHSLSQSFVKGHLDNIQQAFTSVEGKGEISLKNSIPLEKDKGLARAVESSILSHSAIENTEELVRDFLCIFVPSATEIYDALIGLITDVETEDELLKGHIFMNFEKITPSLDLIRSERFEA